MLVMFDMVNNVHQDVKLSTLTGRVESWLQSSLCVRYLWIMRSVAARLCRASEITVLAGQMFVLKFAIFKV